MINSVPVSLRNKRSKILRTLSIKKRRAFYDSQIGKNQKVLFEGENKKGYIYGFSGNYVKVRTAWDPSLINEIRDVKFDEIDNEGYVRCKIL
jgi:threonylcarbamoyladenosine tRNA methylthiotransferase MtaB